MAGATHMGRRQRPRMVDRNESFMREVDDEVRREKFLKFWEQSGTFVIAGIIGLFIAVGAYKWREHQKVVFEEQSGARFEQALRLAQEKKAEDSLKAFAEIAKDGSDGYRALARLRLSAEQAKAGKLADAMAGYEALGTDTGVEEMIRQLAQLQAAMLRMEQADWTEMKNRLTPLTVETSAWRTMAREMLGMAAYKAGQIEDATKQFETLLGDKATTSGQSRRAQEMLAVLTDAAAAKASPAKVEPAKSVAPKTD